ncbi:hypothetical protein EV426DRAFT_708890 [Tirmania nivea]|nr:hypothetical protein EV426DRAFT_708890 [Tirmania nivea]
MAALSPPPPMLKFEGTVIFRPSRLEVDLLDPGNRLSTTHRLAMCAIKVQDYLDAVEQYENVRRQLVKILQESFTLDNTSSAWGLTLLGRKLIEKPSGWPDPVENSAPHPALGLITPTVFIVCHDPAIIENRLAAISNECALRIEVQLGGIGLYSGRFNMGCKGYEEKVTMGRSIGCADSFLPGSLGGWVMDITTQEILAITAGHVVLGQRYGQLDALPYHESGQTIMQPADPDFEETLTEAERVLKTAHMKSEQCGFMNPKLEHYRLEAQTHVNKLKLLGAQRIFGTVLHGGVDIVTGSEDSNRRMFKDYGIISSLAARVGDCAYGFLGTPLTLANGQTSVYEGQEVFKSFTRSSGQTDGKVNGIHLDTNMSCRLLKQPQAEITHEWIAIGENNGPMSAPGDSGALLMDVDDYVVGMVIGGMTNTWVENRQRFFNNITIFTPAEQLLKWMKEDLGRDVVFGA